MNDIRLKDERLTGYTTKLNILSVGEMIFSPAPHVCRKLMYGVGCGNRSYRQLERGNLFGQVTHRP